MVDPGFGAAAIGWVVNKLLDKVALALRDTVNLPKYCEQLNVYVLRIRPLVVAAEGFASRSALPQGHGDIQVKAWLQEVKLVLEAADVQVAKCGALPAGKLDSIVHAIRRLKLSKEIGRLTRRLKELASTEATWACLAKQEAIQVSVAAQGYLVERIRRGTDDNQVLVEEVKELILEKLRAADGVDEAVKQLVEEVRSFEEGVTYMNQAVVDEMNFIQALRAEMQQNGKVVTDICCRKTTELDQHVSLEFEEMKRLMMEWFSQVQKVQMEGESHFRLHIEAMKRQVAASGVPTSLASLDLECVSHIFSGDKGGRERGGSMGLAVLISMEKGKPWVSVDRALLEALASRAGFDVKVIKDRTADELGSMMRWLEEPSSGALLADCDSFVCFVTADVGIDGGEFFLDEHGDSVYLDEDIVQHFLLSPHLSGKPKTFIFAGCRTLVMENPDVYSALGNRLHKIPGVVDELPVSTIVFIMPNTLPQAASYVCASPFVRKFVESCNFWHKKQGIPGLLFLLNLESILLSALSDLCAPRSTGEGPVHQQHSIILAGRPLERFPITTSTFCDRSESDWGLEVLVAQLREADESDWEDAASELDSDTEDSASESESEYEDAACDIPFMTG